MTVGPRVAVPSTISTTLSARLRHDDRLPRDRSFACCPRNSRRRRRSSGEYAFDLRGAHLEQLKAILDDEGSDFRD